MPPDAFSQKVIEVVKKIPRGRVATYQQVAGLAGKLHASRGVAWILNSSSKKYKLPWQRVINSKGGISFKPGTHHFMMQKRLLTKEGVEVDSAGKIDLKCFQYRKKPKTIRRRNQPRMFGL